MRVLGIIPARYESSRFPGKPLIDLQGKTMIQRVYEGAAKCSLLDKLIVATDDERIFNTVKRFGGEVMMTKSSHQNGTERCGEVLEKHGDYDVIVNVQGDEPLINPLQLENLIELFNDKEVAIGTIAKPMNDMADIRNPNRIKVVLDAMNNGIYFSRSPIPHVAGLAHENWMDKATFYKHIGLYAWKKEILQELLALPSTALEKIESLEQLRWIYNGYKIRCAISGLDTPNIDVPEDVNKVLALL